MANVKYSVFALGSTAYPNFCEFGHTVDEIFKKLGGEEVYPIGEGDELNEQEASFKEWAQNCFKVNLFCKFVLKSKIHYCLYVQQVYYYPLY